MNDPVIAGERPLNILLIDDDDMDAKSLERAFRVSQEGTPGPVFVNSTGPDARVVVD